MFKKIYMVIEKIFNLVLITTIIYLLIKMNDVLHLLKMDIQSTQEILQSLCDILKGSWFF